MSLAGATHSSSADSNAEEKGTLSNDETAKTSSSITSVLQKSDSSYNGTEVVRSSHVISLPFAISVPVLFVIVTAVVVLLMVLVWLNYRSKRKITGLQPGTGYRSVPTEEDVSHTKTSPYLTSTSSKRKVQLMDPPIPGVSTQFVEAAQLGLGEEKRGGGAGGARYPYTHHSGGFSDSDKQLSRKSNAMKSRSGGAKVQFNDRSSDGSENGYSSPNKFRSSDSTNVSPPTTIRSLDLRRTRTLTTPATVGKEVVQLPELSISLIYKEQVAVLAVKVESATRLPYREDGNPVDSYVRLFFVPKLPDMPQRKTSKTEVKRKEVAPVFNEEIHHEAMSMEELINSVLYVEVLDYCSFGKHRVLGQANLPLVQVQFIAGEASMTLSLTPPIVRENLGTILISISYSHDSKKLGVIILRAKDLNKGNCRETDVQAKVWITLCGDKILGRMRTKKKLQSCSPIFNETLSCTVEPAQVKNAAINVALINDNRYGTNRELGQVIICSQCMGEEYRHWSDVMATPGKPIAEWHTLR